MPRRRNSAFTLIELLVVIAVIAALAAILFPVFAAARAKARQAACYSNLHQIGVALGMYVQDNDEHMPNGCHWGRAWAWLGWYANLETCAQDGITQATPRDTMFLVDQSPPRYVQELLHPYVRNNDAPRGHPGSAPALGRAASSTATAPGRPTGTMGRPISGSGSRIPRPVRIRSAAGSGSLSAVWRSPPSRSRPRRR